MRQTSIAVHEASGRSPADSAQRRHATYVTLISGNGISIAKVGGGRFESQKSSRTVTISIFAKRVFITGYDANRLNAYV